MSIGKNQITGSFVVTNFPAMILFQSKFYFFMLISIIHIISSKKTKKNMWIIVKNGQPVKSLWIISPNKSFLGFFALKNQFHGVLTWSHYWMDKYDIWVADEMDMTPLQVRYSWGKFLPQTLSGTPLTIIYTRCSSWHEGLGCHASMTTSNKYISFLTTDLWNVEICCWFILIEYGHA